MELVGVVRSKVLLLHRFSLLPQYGPRKRRNRPTIALASVSSAWAFKVAVTWAFAGRQRSARFWLCATWTPLRREAAKKTVEQRYAEQIKSGIYKGCAAYNDFRELIDRKDIDAIVIATPDHWHAIPCPEAIKAKKDVYCEKPLTLTIKEAKMLIDAARKYERVFQTGSQQRSSGEFRKACELVRSGRIGKLQAVYVNVGTSSKPCDLPEEELEKGLDWDRWLGCAPNGPITPSSARAAFTVISRPVQLSRVFRRHDDRLAPHHFDIAQWGLGMDESGRGNHSTSRSEGRAWAALHLRRWHSRDSRRGIREG